MPVRRCVGAVIYDGQGRVFLMTSPKWGDNYIVPGGEINPGETPLQALRREITEEELGIELCDVVYAGRSTKRPGTDFQDPDTTFNFTDYYARAEQTAVNPNDEIGSWGWFAIDDALRLPLLDSTMNLLTRYISYRKRISEK